MSGFFQPSGMLRPDDYLVILSDQNGERAFWVDSWEIDIRAGVVRPVFDQGKSTRDLSPFTQVRLVSRETVPSYLYEAGLSMLVSEAKNPTK